MSVVMSGVANLAALTTAISSRYSVAGCISALQTDFTNNYNNWYLPRINAGTGIQSILTKWGTYTEFTSIETQMTSISSTMASTFTTLNGSINSLVDPTYGMVAGVNCLLIG
jgi:hypothetical protein